MEFIDASHIEDQDSQVLFERLVTAGWDPILAAHVVEAAADTADILADNWEDERDGRRIEIECAVERITQLLHDLQIVSK